MSKAGEAVYEGVLTRGNVSPRAMESMVNVLVLGKGSDSSTDDSSSSRSSDERSGDPKSKQLSGDPFASMAKGEFVPPRHNPQVWAAAMEQSTRLGRCIRTYARNTVGLGWFIEPISKVSPETPKDLRVKIENQTVRLQKLFDRPNPLMPTTQLFFMAKTDEEAIGNGYIEIVRDNAGKIAGLFHVPGVSMRIRVREGANREQMIGGFVQIRGNEKRYFKEFGDTKVMVAESGEYYKGHKPLATDQRATEILHFKLYSPTSTWYGAPRYLSAAPAISGNRLAALRNVNFFENDAVPRMALLVSGGTLTPESVQSIEDFFKAKVQGVNKAHSVCVIQAEQRQVGFQQQGRGPRLDLKPLTVGVTEDASFETYRKSNDEEIRESFGLAPVFFTTTDVNKACVSGSTIVLLADGTEKTIRELVEEYGDDGEFPIYGFCKAGGEVGIAKGRAPRVTKTAKVFEIVAESGEVILEATNDHEVLLDNEAYAFVRDLLPGDLLMRYSVDGDEVKRCDPYKVKSVQFTGRTEEVYDLTSDVYHNFIVGSGMVVHNSAQVCVTGDTRIPLLDSNCPTIQELAEKYKDDPEACFPVFSIDEEGQMVVGWGYYPRKTKKARVFDVLLDNGMSIRATSDHPFMLRSGEYREVKDLTPGLSLMPWYVRMPFNQNMSPESTSYGYWDVYDPSTDKYGMIHNMVARSRGDDLSQDVVVHHEDGDPLNNHPENLSTVDRAWHCRHHRDGNNQYTGSNHPRYQDVSFERVCEEARACAGRNGLLKALGIGTSALTRILTENGYSYDTFSKKFMLPRGKPPAGVHNWRFRQDATFEALAQIAPSCFYRRDLVKASGYSPNLIYRLLRENGYSYGEFRNKFMATSRREATETVVNHRVVAVRYAGEEDVYDISVHDHHNFATGAGVVISNSREVCNEQELEPDRLEKEYIINQTIVADVLEEEPLVRFRFERMKLTDPLDTARMDQTYAGLGALTPNELRSSIGKPPYPKDYKFADKPMQVAMAELSMQLAEAIIGEFKSQIDHQTEQAKAQQQSAGMGGMLEGAPEGEGGEEAPPEEPDSEEEGIEEWSDDASTDESSPISDESDDSEETDSSVNRVHEALGIRKNGSTARKSQVPLETVLGLATELMTDARGMGVNLPDLTKEE